MSRFRSPHAALFPFGLSAGVWGLTLVLLGLPSREAGAEAHPSTGWLARQECRRLQLQPGERTEPTTSQKLYDARYYRLDLTVDPLAKRIEGTALARLEIRPDSLGRPVALDSLELNLDDSLTVSQVSLGGEEGITFRHEGGLLRVTLDRPYGTGEELSLLVTYRGRPRRDAFHFDAVAGKPMIWTLSAPYGARGWWPCKDYPEDKADSVDVRVTVPADLEAAGNGILRQRTAGAGSVTSLWHEDHPIATYLVSLVAHPYSVYRDIYRPSPADSMPIVFYNVKTDSAAWVPVQAKVKEMLGAFARIFGEYPFLGEKYGHAQVPLSGGMENQTLTSLGSNNELVVAHELAHQWWGDAVTCENFHDVWLNEGFATYCQSLWRESSEGPEAYREEIGYAEYFGPGTIYVEDIGDPNRIYDQQLSYNKGAWVLHMLRHVVGDEAFSRILREHFLRHLDSVVTTDSLRGVAEEISGLDLSAFFRQWIHGERYPIYQYDWSATPGGPGWDLGVRVAQLQSWQLFNMPIDLRVTLRSEGGTVDSVYAVPNSTAEATYTLHLAHEPIAVALDPERWILRQVYEPMPEPAFDRPLLLVNGVPWTPSSLAQEIAGAYQDRAFTGSAAFDFWDYHTPPVSGYPSNLPAPLGHGAIPGDVLGRYQTVIWVGNNFGGDAAGWTESPLYAYLKAGGNALLMAPSGSGFLPDPFRSYLGIRWTATDTVRTWDSMVPGLPDLHPLGEQTQVSSFELEPGSTSTLLYKDGRDPVVGLGVLQAPAGGGTHNPQGGNFVFLSGRPYRWNHDDLRACLDFLLSHILLPEPPVGQPLALQTPRPNPFRGQTTLRFFLPTPGRARIVITDPAGRRVRLLGDQFYPGGLRQEVWDGRDDNGRPAPSGLYFCALDAGGRMEARKVIRLR